jgi:flavin reductase (DIM6/NTAB) family NADH-FMN oxidoreductase RutF
MAKEVDFCGIYSGSKEDKSNLFSLFYGSMKTAPLIEECPINFECSVVRELELGSHILFIGEVKETHVSEDCMIDGTINTESVDPLIFTAATREYHRLGDVVAPAFSIGKKR